MSTVLLLVHALIKHAVVVVFLGLLVDPINTSVGAMTSQDNSEPFTLVLTVAGLILAGAISGFFQFTYQKVNQEQSRALSPGHLLLGHVTTATHLFVLGVLLLVSVTCLRQFAVTSELGLWPFWLAVVLYASLVLYDVFDLMTLPQNA